MEDTAREASAGPGDSSPGVGAPLEYGRLWQLGNPPDLHQFSANSGNLSATQLPDILRVDQRQRWKRSDRVLAEEYFRAYPDLQAKVEEAIDLIYSEFLLRQELGE